MADDLDFAASTKEWNVMKVIGYIRVSTHDQAAEGVSLEAQNERIKGWCLSRGLSLDNLRVFADAGISGKRADNRPGLKSALEAVCEVGGILVVYSLSRLARSTKDAISIAERLTKAGAELVSLTENLDTTTATGKLLYRMLSILAEFERDLIAERTLTALAFKRSKSERLGQVPYGSKLEADGVTLASDAVEQALIAYAVDLRSEGYSLGVIAATLTALGFPTKNGGPKWAPTSVAEILKREKLREAAATSESTFPEQAHADLPVA